MTKKLISLGGAAAIALVGCLGEDTANDSQSVKANKAVQLNLSHIECTDDGVLAHFVLLFAGPQTPSDLTGTWSGGDFGPIAPGKNTGNVWHYNVILPAGEIEILSAEATSASGNTATLHNPSEYSGDYQCSPPEICPVVVEPIESLCIDTPLGNPGDECAFFGLQPQGKDDGLSGTTFEATQDAYVALVKTGKGSCEPGEINYQVYVGVSAGDELSSPADSDISHVTYCACPD